MDAEKAFDCVSWEFLFATLERFGFDEKSVNCIKTVYSAPTARIKINGRLTDRIKIERSTRQGCPLSPTLFALYIEPLAQAIREDNNIEGIIVKGREHKIAVYADDVLLFVRSPDTCLPILLDLLAKFGNFSGYKLNIQKTQILAFDYSPTPELKQDLPIDWSQKAIKYLGIWLTHCPDDLYKRNYMLVNKMIKEDLSSWSTPLLSFSARIEAVKMLILPRLLYLFTSLPIEVPPYQFSEWDKQISRFIWGGKKSRVKYSLLTRNKGGGGMSLPNLKSYYLAAQLRIIVLWCDNTYEAKWKEIEKEYRGIPIQAMIADHKLMLKY